MHRKLDEALGEHRPLSIAEADYYLLIALTLSQPGL